MFRFKYIIGATCACVAITDWDSGCDSFTVKYKKTSDEMWAYMLIEEEQFKNNAYRADITGLEADSSYEMIVTEVNGSDPRDSNSVYFTTDSVGTIGIINDSPDVITDDAFSHVEAFMDKLNSTGVSKLSFLGDDGINSLTISAGEASGGAAEADTIAKSITYRIKTGADWIKYEYLWDEGIFTHEMRHINKVGWGLAARYTSRFHGGVSQYMAEARRNGGIKEKNVTLNRNVSVDPQWDLNNWLDNFYSFKMGAYDDSGNPCGKIYFKGVHSTIEEHTTDLVDYFFLKAQIEPFTIYNVVVD